MGRCPKCNSKIDHLYLDVIETTRFDVYLNDKGKMNGDEIDCVQEEPVAEFKCPECGEIIAETDEEAEDILKSDLIEEKIQTE